MTPAPERSSQQASVAAILEHHTALLHGMERRAGAVIAAAGSGAPHEPPLTAFAEFVACEVLPHAEAEEQTLYRAAEAIPSAALLVKAMKDEHRRLGSLAGSLTEEDGPVAAATAAASIATLFAAHVAKENDFMLPVLTDSGVDLTDLLADTHHLLSG